MQTKERMPQITLPYACYLRLKMTAAERGEKIYATAAKAITKGLDFFCDEANRTNQVKGAK